MGKMSATRRRRGRRLRLPRVRSRRHGVLAAVWAIIVAVLGILWWTTAGVLWLVAALLGAVVAVMAAIATFDPDTAVPGSGQKNPPKRVCAASSITSRHSQPEEARRGAAVQAAEADVLGPVPHLHEGRVDLSMRVRRQDPRRRAGGGVMWDLVWGVVVLGPPAAAAAVWSAREAWFEVWMSVAVGVWSGNPWIGLGAGLVAGVASVWLFPTTKCWYCGPRGGPRRMDSKGENWHDCFVCGGSGKRKRFLARIFGGIDD
jgi:hypothetical protein